MQAALFSALSDSVIYCQRKAAIQSPTMSHMPTFNENITDEFEGQYALITGGAAGIGLQCSKELLCRGIQKLAIVDKVVLQDACRRLVMEFGRDRLMFVRCDISVPEELENAFNSVYKNFNALDIVINNAGILDDAAWEKEILTNLNGTVRGTLLGMKYMSKPNGGAGGTIINVSSLSGLAPAAGCPIYSATSHGIIGFTRSFALPFHFLQTGVRMMSVCPGITYTKIISGATKKMLSDDMGKEWLKELSLTSTQKPENVAVGITHMLMYGENGTVWVSDGGKTVHEVTFPTPNEMRKI